MTVGVTVQVYIAFWMARKVLDNIYAEGRDLAARIQCNIPHHRFAELVFTRDMGCLLDFTLREVIEACLILAGRSIKEQTVSVTN